MKKRIIAMTLTAAGLASLCACGVDKPDLKSVSDQTNSTEVTSAATTEKKKLTRQDSYILGEMADKFQVEAEIINEKTSLPSCYYLSRINMTADQIAERLLSDTGYSRDDIGHGIVAFSNGNEKLVLDPDGRSTGPFFPSPNLTYALDKGKEYEAVVKGLNINESSDSDEAKKAVNRVKEMLSKLPVEYDDNFEVEEYTHEALNEYYSMFNFSPEEPLDIPDEIQDQSNRSEDKMISGNILLYSEGKDAKLDKDFKFSEDDSCYIVTGNMKVSDLQITDMFFNTNSISAAVSSRGIEYLYVENLYIPDNGSSETPIISPEQAIESLYNDYAASPNKDNFKVEINKISLNYMKENESSDTGKTGTSTVKLRPVWALSLYIHDIEKGEEMPQEAYIYADNGKLITLLFEKENSIMYYTGSEDMDYKGE